MSYDFGISYNEDRFRRPTSLVNGEDEFKDNEVGITHPETSGFIRLKDNGDIEIVAGEGVMIVMQPASKTITFVADSIKFMTRDRQGLRWNGSYFNENAANFNEPTLVPADDQGSRSLYKGVEYFLKPDPEAPNPLPVPGQAGMSFPQVMVTDPESGESISYYQYYEKYKTTPRFGAS